MVPIPGPGSINRIVQGPAYVWAVLHDDRKDLWRDPPRKRLREEEILRRGGQGTEALRQPGYDVPEIDYEDIDETPEDELEALEERIIDDATTARTIAELRAEIAILEGLEKLALQVRRSGTDRK